MHHGSTFESYALENILLGKSQFSHGAQSLVKFCLMLLEIRMDHGMYFLSFGRSHIDVRRGSIFHVLLK